MSIEQLKLMMLTIELRDRGVNEINDIVVIRKSCSLAKHLEMHN